MLPFDRVLPGRFKYRLKQMCLNFKWRVGMGANNNNYIPTLEMYTDLPQQVLCPCKRSYPL